MHTQIWLVSVQKIELTDFGYIYNCDQNENCTRFGGTYTKIGTIQRRLAWPLRKDDTQIREAFHIFRIISNKILHKLFQALKMQSYSGTRSAEN